MKLKSVVEIKNQENIFILLSLIDAKKIHQSFFICLKFQNSETKRKMKLREYYELDNLFAIRMNA